MKKAKANIEISVTFKCPECGSVVDLLDSNFDTSGDYSRMAGGFMLGQSVSEWVQCDECEQEFTINELEM